MRLFLLTSVTMIAFASNSILNRMSLAELEIGPGSFAFVRVVAGALVLLGLVFWTQGRAQVLPSADALRTGFLSAVFLAVYLVGFSFAYVSLDTGIGALLLFGGVQITMFAGALLGGEEVTKRRAFSSALAFSGLVWLLLPNASAPPLMGSLLMVAAALGWGGYSMLGRRATQPLVQAQHSFLFALPLVALVWATLPDALEISARGFVLAVISGAGTSGLGYALWYSVLPRLDSVTAAVAQLTVPIIAVVGGYLVLGEPITPRFVVAAALVLTGVLLAAKK